MIGAILDVTFQKTTAADGTVTVEIQNPVLHPGQPAIGLFRAVHP